MPNVSYISNRKCGTLLSQICIATYQMDGSGGTRLTAPLQLRLVVTHPRSSQVLTLVLGCPLAVDLFTKQNDVIVMSLLSWYSVSWYSVVFSICKQDMDVIVMSLLSWYSVSWYSVVFSICKQDMIDKKYTVSCSLRNNVRNQTRTIFVCNNETLSNLRHLCQIVSSLTKEIFIIVPFQRYCSFCSGVF